MTHKTNLDIFLENIQNKPFQPMAMRGGLQSFDNFRPPAAKMLPPVIYELLSKPVDFYRPKGEAVALTPESVTHVAFALDESSSMSRDKHATIEGYNAQLDARRDDDKEVGDLRFTDCRFSSEVRFPCLCKSINEMENLTLETYTPSGGTSLYDALGETIAMLLSTEEIWAPTTACLVTLFTDGEENTSRTFSASILREVIACLEATGRWTFLLLGPRSSVGSLADILAIDRRNVEGYDISTAAGKTEAFSKVVGATNSYMAMRSMGGSKLEAAFATELPKT
ncbi:VWA domain-containing protein [Nostoc sp. CHAB 5834]|nr:VWA domain-containing protein [Nostoc sp. CHAB 5834]